MEQQKKTSVDDLQSFLFPVFPVVGGGGSDLWFMLLLAFVRRKAGVGFPFNNAAKQGKLSLLEGLLECCARSRVSAIGNEWKINFQLQSAGSFVLWEIIISRKSCTDCWSVAMMNLRSDAQALSACFQVIFDKKALKWGAEDIVKHPQTNCEWLSCF